MLKVSLMAVSALFLAISSYALDNNRPATARHSVQPVHAHQDNSPKAVKQKKQDPAMIYYSALIQCKKGFYRFPNPVFAKEIHSHQVIEANILGNIGGFCHVNLYFDHAKDRLSCLYTAHMRKTFAADENIVSFKRAYTQGYFDSGAVTVYDKATHKACESF